MNFSEPHSYRELRNQMLILLLCNLRRLLLPLLKALWALIYNTWLLVELGRLVNLVDLLG